MARTAITLRDEDLETIKEYCKKHDFKVSCFVRKSAIDKIRSEQNGE